MDTKSETTRISLLEKLLLLFKKPYIANDGNYFLMAKRLFGRIYIIKEWTHE